MYAGWQPPEFSPQLHGILIFTPRGSHIEIRAYAPGATGPVLQTVDTNQPAVDAEVLAVRAVETLRAAIIQYARRARDQQLVVPPTISAFARTDPAPADADRGTAAPEEDDASRATGGGLTVSAWVGPTASFDRAADYPSVGGRMSLFFGYSWYGLGITGQGSALPLTVSAAEGEVEARRLALMAHAHGQVDFGTHFLGFAQLGFGLAHYGLKTTPSPGFSGLDSSHLTPVGSLEVGTGYWFAKRLGAYALGGASVALDSPRFRFDDRPIGNLERPHFGVSIGVIVGTR